MGNNPISNIDPKGDNPVLIGAAIGLLSNGVQNISSGNNFFQGGFKATFFGAWGGGISSSIGGAAQAIANAGASQLGVGAFQAGAHALNGGLQSIGQGGNFLHGVTSGGISSSAGSIIAAFDGGATAKWVGGAISGGIGSLLTGGTFVNGVSQGLIVGGLNHAFDEIKYLLTKSRLKTMLRKEGKCTTCTDNEVGAIFQNEIVLQALLSDGATVIPGFLFSTFFGNTQPDFLVVRKGTRGKSDIATMIEVKAKNHGSYVYLSSQNYQIAKQILALSLYMSVQGQSGGQHIIMTTGGVRVSRSIRIFARGANIKPYHLEAYYTGSLSRSNIIFK